MKAERLKMFKSRPAVSAADAVIIAVIAFLGVVFLLLFSGGSGTVAEVYVNGNLVREITLSTDGSYRVETDGGHYNIITVSAGTLYISEADCPDKICMHYGSISRAGQSIICLPHRLEVIIRGESDADAHT